MKKYLLHILIILFVFLHSNIVLATEAYDFTADSIRSLQQCIIANTNYNDLIDNVDETGINLTMALITHKKYMENASSYLKPYASSNDEFIKTTSKMLQIIYDNINQNSNIALELSEEINNYPEKYLEETGTYNRRFGEIAAERISHWKEIPVTIAIISYCLVEKGEIKLLMKITPEELWALKKQLIKVFGNTIKTGNDGDRPSLEAAGMILYSFLNQNWNHVTKENGKKAIHKSEDPELKKKENKKKKE